MLDAVLALNETDTQVFDFASQAAPPIDNPSGHIVVPDAHLLFNGEFKRVGTSDLKIVGDDGASFFIRDYFGSDKASHLISPEGATLSASVVAALAGPLAPGQSAQAGAQQSGQPVIGRVDTLSGSCNVVRNGVSVALNIGDTVRKGDVVQTAGGSAVAIVFTDGSTFSLNANARMVLDDFVYAAGGAGNSALISLVQGTFSFVAGQVAKTGDMRVDTPVATMGIRGTAVLVEISANDGQTRFSVMVEPDGTTGSFNLYNKTTGSLIGTVSSSQIGWLVTPAGPLQVVAQQLQKTPAQLQQELGIVQQIFTIFNNNQQNPFVDPERRGDNPNDPNPQTAQGSSGGSGGPLGGDTSEGAAPGIVNHLPQPGTYVFKLPPLPGSPPPIIPEDAPNVVTVVVTPNAPPIAVNDPEGSSGGGDVIENDSDPEGSVVVVTAAQHLVQNAQGQDVPTGPVVPIDADGEEIVGTYGTLTLHPNGTYTFTPNEAFKQLADGQQVIEKFQYTISDPFGATATAVLSINLTGVNATDDTESTSENATLFVDVLANDVQSAQTKTLTELGDITVTGPDGVTLGNPAIVIENNKIRVTPGSAFDALAEGEEATITVAYTVTANGVTYNAVATITVTGTNDTPYFSLLPEGLESVGTTHETTFGGVDALQLVTEGASQSQIEEFLGLTAGTLDSVEADTTDGAAVAFNLTLAQNETVSFSWNFASTEYEPFNDYTFFSVSSNTAVRLSDIYTIGDSANDGYLHSSGWQQFTFTATAATQYRFGIGVMNEGDTAYDSNLYISGFSGLGFKRTTTENGDVETFDLLNGAYDPDTHDTLSATSIVASGKDHLGNIVDVTGAIAINGNSVTIDPEFFSYLSTGQSVTVVVNYDLSDGNTTTHNSATLVIDGEGISNAPPVISIADAAIVDADCGTTLSGVSVSDPDAALGEIFHTTLVAQHGTLALKDPYINNLDKDTSDNAMSFDISLGSIDGALKQGVTYSAEAAPGNSAQPLVDTVTLTIEDSHGGKDSLNFIFSVYGNEGINLLGTTEKDVLFGTAYGDNLTGGTGADIFVFSRESFYNGEGTTHIGPGQDTITDFIQGQDKIALYGIYEDYDDMVAAGALNNENLAPNQIDLGCGNVITLNGVTVADLAPNDFIFHQNGSLFA